MANFIQQQVCVDANAQDVFDVLTQGERFSQLTGGAPAHNEGVEGDRFEGFGGMIHGRNIELIPGQRIVQAWRPKTWEAGRYSIVRFDLRESDGKTTVVMTHEGYPTEQEDHLAQGWQDNYLSPLAAYFRK